MLHLVNLLDSSRSHSRKCRGRATHPWLPFSRRILTVTLAVFRHVGTRCLEDRPTPNSMNSCANIPVVCHSDGRKFVQSQFSDAGGRAGGTCRWAPHPPPQVLSILRTLPIQISTNKRRRLGFVDERVNRNSFCIAHSVTGNAKKNTADKSVRFVESVEEEQLIIMHPSAHNALNHPRGFSY